MKLKIKELDNLADSLQKNLLAVAEEINKINKIMLDCSPRMKQFKKERNELILKNCEKIKDSQIPVTYKENGETRYKIIDVEQHNKEIAKLEKRFKKDINEEIQKDIENKKMLENEIEIKINILNNVL